MPADPTPAPSVPGQPPVAPPDWSTIEHDILCSRCGYNLRMLTQPRCPECGLEFAWSDILARQTSIPWLYEHQWKKRPIRSYFATLRRGFRPRSLFESLSIHDPIAVAPLLQLLLSPILLFLVACSAITLAAKLVHQNVWGPYPYFYWPSDRPPVNPIQRAFEDLARRAPSSAADVLELAIFPGMVVYLPLTLFLILCFLRRSKRLFNVRNRHWLRITALVSTPYALLCVIAWPCVPALTSARELALIGVGVSPLQAAAEAIACAAPLLWLAYAMSVGFSRYLMLPHTKGSAFALLSLALTLTFGAFFLISAFM